MQHSQEQSPRPKSISSASGPPEPQQQVSSASQPQWSTSQFRPEPMPASTIADVEVRRRDALRRLGPCRSGCKELDEYVLLAGGFERGCVVGISAEDEDGVGVVLGLQVLICSLLDGAASRALVVTPKPSNALLVPLRNGITAELATRGIVDAAEVASKRRECLDRVMLSCVFDMDGLCEVLGDLDKPRPNEQTEENEKLPTSPMPLPRGSSWQKEAKTSRRPSFVSEIQDSQDEDEILSSSSPTAQEADGQCRQQEKYSSDCSNTGTTAPASVSAKHHHNTNDKGRYNSPLPDIIVITHFSSLLTSLFTHREKTAAHTALQHLASRLRHLSRTLPSNPLIIMLNSTDSSAPSMETYNHQNLATNPQPVISTTGNKSSIDPTLRSIFNAPPPTYAAHLYSDTSVRRRLNKTNKSSFGLVFTQLLDLHLLCTRVLRDTGDAEYSFVTTSTRLVTVVEVLLDEVGMWEGKRGTRRRREQRWAAVDLRGGRIVNAF